MNYSEFTCVSSLISCELKKMPGFHCKLSYKYYNYVVSNFNHIPSVFVFFYYNETCQSANNGAPLPIWLKVCTQLLSNSYFKLVFAWSAGLIKEK